MIQDWLTKTFLGVEFVFTKNLVIDVTNKDDQLQIISQEHARAHRGQKETVLKILQSYLFAQMRKAARLTYPIAMFI